MSSCNAQYVCLCVCVWKYVGAWGSHIHAQLIKQFYPLFQF